MKYTYQDIYNKRIIGVPLWACNYGFDIVQWGKEKTQEPILGEIEQGGFGYDDLAFIPYTKSGKKAKNNRAAAYFTQYYYADTKEECQELFTEILEKKIQWCNETIKKLQCKIDEMKGLR